MGAKRALIVDDSKSARVFLSRILGALTLCGLVEEARAFLQALEREVHEYRGSHASLPLHHWRLALRG